MRALKLIQLMKTKAPDLSAELVRRIRASDKCKELSLRVPEGEQEQHGLEILQDLTDWLSNETDATIEARYVALGIRRAGQKVPVCELCWAITIARECLWDYTQHECLLEEPVEFWGGVVMLRSLNSFFDRALYFAALGYAKAESDEAATLSFLAQKRSA